MYLLPRWSRNGRTNEVWYAGAMWFVWTVLWGFFFSVFSCWTDAVSDIQKPCTACVLLLSLKNNLRYWASHLWVVGSMHVPATAWLISKFETIRSDTSESPRNSIAATTVCYRILKDEPFLIWIDDFGSHQFSYTCNVCYDTFQSSQTLQPPSFPLLLLLDHQRFYFSSNGIARKSQTWFVWNKIMLAQLMVNPRDAKRYLCTWT